MRVLIRFAQRYLKPYLPWYAVGTVLLAATNWLSVTIPLYLAQGIDALPLGDEGRPIMLWSAMMVAGMGGAIIVVRTASRLLFFTPGRLVEARVKHDLFARLLRQQPAFHDRFPAGDLMSRASSDVNMVRLLAGFTMLGVVNTTVATAMAGTQMFRLSPTLALAVVFPMLMAFGFTLFFVNRLFSVMKRLQEQIATVSDHVLSSYQGVATIHAFRAEKSFFSRFDKANEAWLHTTLERARLRVAIGPVLALATSFNVFLILWIGGPMTQAGQLTVGELIAFTTLVGYVAMPLRGMSFILMLFRQAEASLERIGAIMEPELDRPDLPSPAPPPPGAPAIQVRNLSFRYAEGETDALRGVSLSLGSGQTLGVFGPTGSGKTTLLRCITRLYNPPARSVFIDGVDITTLDLDAWRGRMSVVPQRAFLFTDTVAANILLGGQDQAALQRVVDMAALRTDIDALPQGLDTEVGEAGLTLSGGQRQRVALARGLYRPHQLLVLDDVLSAVDHGTEHQLLDELRTRTERPTTIIVSNRISAIRHADTIVILDGGRVVQQDNHAALLTQPGLYRDTWERQQRGASE